jgi:hypothetical protein
VENVFRPIGQGGTTATVRFEGIKITGGNYTGSTGSGAAIAEGSMSDTSSHYGIEVMNNEAAGILSAKGTFDRVEFTNNTLVSGALGVIGAGLIEYNEVHGNSADENRGGISVRDAQNATIRYNRFGRVTIGTVTYNPNARAAIIASDSGRSDRPNLFNIDILNNTLNGEIIKGCELPDTIVYCPGYTP